MTKKNCWEFMNCGREPGGRNTEKYGECPASATNKSANGCNGGINGGRVCWAVVGTLCGGEIQGNSAKKRLSCMSCEFYNLVKKEEGVNFQTVPKNPVDASEMGSCRWLRLREGEAEDNAEGVK